MSAKKLNRYLLLLFVAGLALSVFLLRYASNWLTTSSQELIALRSEVASLTQKQQDLEHAKKSLGDNEAGIATLKMVLPEDKEQARVIKEIYAIADQANVVIDSVGFPSSTLGSQAPRPATPAPTTDTSAQTSSTPQPSDPNATQTKPTVNVSQATPLKDIPGVQSIELSIGSITSKDASIKGVRYDEMTSLIRLIERNRRTMQIRSIGIGQSESSGTDVYNLTLSIVIFIQP